MTYQLEGQSKKTLNKPKRESGCLSLASFSDGKNNKAYRNYIPAAQIFGYLRVRPSLLDPRKRIPHKKLIASGTSRFDKDIYCKT